MDLKNKNNSPRSPETCALLHSVVTQVKPERWGAGERWHTCASFCGSVHRHPHRSLCISACLARWRSRGWWGPACRVCGLLSLIRCNSRGNPGSAQTSTAAAWSSSPSPPVTATLPTRRSPHTVRLHDETTTWPSAWEEKEKQVDSRELQERLWTEPTLASQLLWIASCVPPGRKKPQSPRLCFLFKEFF